MRESGVKPCNVSYNAAIAACGKSKQVKQALDLFEELNAAGNLPDVVTYSALIDACGRANLLDQAFALLTRWDVQTALASLPCPLTDKPCLSTNPVAGCARRTSHPT